MIEGQLINFTLILFSEPNPDWHMTLFSYLAPFKEIILDPPKSQFQTWLRVAEVQFLKSTIAVPKLF
jgi:hypothetical protein